MPNISDLTATKPNTLSIDWANVEQAVGFPLHHDLKDFYSRIAGQPVRGSVNFVEGKFFEPTGNEKFDQWISFNECEGDTEFTLYLIKSAENAAAEVKRRFEEWTGDNDFGHRVMLGDFYFNIGEVLILFNNDTGKVEWIDCGYGYFDVYEENPNGVLANNLTEFLEKLKNN